MRPRRFADLGLAAYLVLTSVPVLMIIAAFTQSSSEPSFLHQLAPMGCIVFFVPAHLAACLLISIDLVQRRRLVAGILTAAAVLFGGPLAVLLYCWYRLRPNLSVAATPESGTVR